MRAAVEPNDEYKVEIKNTPNRFYLEDHLEDTLCIDTTEKHPNIENIAKQKQWLISH